jgi:hypothetical protein
VTVVAGVVVETLPGRAGAVAGRIGGTPHVTVHGDDGDRRIAAVFSADDGATLEALSEELLALDEEIVGVFPAFAGTDAA